MLPVLLYFTFTSLWSQLVLYALALGAVLYIAWNGWRGASGAPSDKGEPLPPTSQQRLTRALTFGAIASVLAFYGLRYALPATAFPGGRGEGIPLHTYGLLLAAGFLTATQVAARIAQQEYRRVQWVEGQGWVDVEGPRKREQFLDLSFWLLVGGLVGSRLLFVLVNWKDYARDLTQIFSLGGGLVFYGGLIGAGLAAFLFARQYGLNFLRMGDVILPTVSLGQCLGRLGCFSAGCCWGDVTHPHLSWAAHFPGASVVKDLFGQHAPIASLAFQSQATDKRYVVEATGEVIQQAVPGAVRISEWVAQHGTTLPVHPTQLYESAGQLLLFVGLLYARRFKRFHGQVFALWLMAYAVLRTSVELFRGDLERGTLHGLLQSLGARSLAEAVPLAAWYNISTSQFISLCMFAFGAILLYHGGRRTAAGSGARPSPSPA